MLKLILRKLTSTLDLCNLGDVWGTDSYCERRGGPLKRVLSIWDYLNDFLIFFKSWIRRKNVKKLDCWCLRTKWTKTNCLRLNLGIWEIPRAINIFPCLELVNFNYHQTPNKKTLCFPKECVVSSVVHIETGHSQILGSTVNAQDVL